MKELIVGICDDEAIILDRLKQIVMECIKSKNMDFEVRTFHSGTELLENAHLYDIVFLDIQMPDMDGYETGRRLQKVNPNCKIIIATSRTDRYKEAFKIRAVRFVTKPFDVNEIHEAIDNSLLMKAGMEMIELHYNRILYKIRQKDIKYVAAYDSYIECKVGERMYRKESSLSKLEEILDSNIFFRVNKKYIINFLWIKGHKDGVVYIEDLEIDVSRRKRTTFDRAYMNFDVNYR